ncbi:MAG: single-stranded DNA-binding protein, partial [Verrucomicrobia bacterium]|nr:single-stranded DNA-binding protein [Verrucomicrobiota bacterium]
DQWEGPEGEKKSRMRVRADRVQFLSRGGGSGGGARAGKGGPATADDGGGSGKSSAPARDIPEDDVPF